MKRIKDIVSDIASTALAALIIAGLWVAAKILHPMIGTP